MNMFRRGLHKISKRTKSAYKKIKEGLKFFVKHPGKGIAKSIGFLITSIGYLTMFCIAIPFVIPIYSLFLTGALLETTFITILYCVKLYNQPISNNEPIYEITSDLTAGVLGFLHILPSFMKTENDMIVMRQEQRVRQEQERVREMEQEQEEQQQRRHEFEERQDREVELRINNINYRLGIEDTDISLSDYPFERTRSLSRGNVLERVRSLSPVLEQPIRERLQYKTISKTCSICLEDNTNYKTNCNHHFHRKCYTKMRLNGIRNCPNCRAHL